jgi:hypothetical protein
VTAVARTARIDFETLSGNEQRLFVVTIDLEEASSESVVVHADDESHAKRRVKQWLKEIRFHHIDALSFTVREYAAVHVLKEEAR